MKLNETGLVNITQWEDKGYILPKYNRKEVQIKTNANPTWIHFGASNIFRAFQANIMQTLLNNGFYDRGIIAVEGYDYEIIEKINNPHDNYSILVTLKSNGEVEKNVIGSITESLKLDSENSINFSRLKEIFQKDSLSMASFTITEKGYSLTNAKGDFLPSVGHDMNQGPSKPESYIGKVTALLYSRFLVGEKPIAMVSMDNCSHNGTKLHDAIYEFAKEWAKNGLVENGFPEYINNPDKVSFPWTMIDKITPRPDSSIENLLIQDEVEEIELIITNKQTYIAPFVNAEECEYLVIEDNFPNGKLPLDKAGVIFTDRETVDKVEKMKVCTCLNPLHTALAIFGCLLGYDLISNEMKDDTLRSLVEGIGYNEGLPVVVNPIVINPKEFIDTVLTTRIPNPFMPDTPQRIATDTSQKLAIRFGETIKSYYASNELDIKGIKLIPLVYAGWLRYLMGIDDFGNRFELSPDPLLKTLCPYVNEIQLGDNFDAYEKLRPILSNSKIFGVNLYDVDMAITVSNYFKEMTTSIGAVRATLEKYV